LEIIPLRLEPLLAVRLRTGAPWQPSAFFPGREGRALVANDKTGLERLSRD